MEMEFGIWNGMMVGILEEEDDQILISLNGGEEKWVNEMSVDLVER